MDQHVPEVAVPLVGKEGGSVEDMSNVFAFGQDVPVRSDNPTNGDGVRVICNTYRGPFYLLGWGVLKSRMTGCVCSLEVGAVNDSEGIAPPQKEGDHVNTLSMKVSVLGTQSAKPQEFRERNSLFGGWGV